MQNNMQSCIVDTSCMQDQAKYSLLHRYQAVHVHEAVHIHFKPYSKIGSGIMLRFSTALCVMPCRLVSRSPHRCAWKRAHGWTPTKSSRDLRVAATLPHCTLGSHLLGVITASAPVIRASLYMFCKICTAITYICMKYCVPRCR